MYWRLVGVYDLVRGARVNAIIGWVVAAGVVGVAAVSSVTDAPLGGALSLVLVAVVALPAVATHDWTAMVPWPLLAVAAIAVTFRTGGLFPEAAGYVAIASLALVIVVELDVFTPIQLSRRFAIGFAVLMTLAVEAVWIIVQFFSDRWLGTGFLSTQIALQEDIVIVTVVGFAMGGLFYWFFARFEIDGFVNDSSDQEGSP